MSGAFCVEMRHMTTLTKIIRQANQTEFRRFFWAGSFAFCIDFFTLFFLTEIFKVNYLISNLVAVSLGVIISYLLCIKWVFNKRRYNRVALEFQIFVLLSIIGLILNESLLWSFVEVFKTHYLVAKIIVTLAIFVVNFFLKKVVLFRQ